MKDNELKQILQRAAAADESIDVPDMSVKLKNIAARAPVAAQSETDIVSVGERGAAATIGKRKKRTLMIVAGILLVILTASFFVWFLGFRLGYDFNIGAMASKRAANAQYLPNVEVLTSPQTGYMQSNFLETETDINALGLDDFFEINAALAYVDGTCVNIPNEYDIFEIKEEVEFVLNAAPIFGKWFSMPWMDETHGHISNFPYQYWAYYLESNNDATEVSVTRVCSKPATYYDMDSGVRFDVWQWQLMQAKYYTDGEGREVVECYVLSLVTDLKDRANGSWNDSDILEKVNYIPISVEYMKNVKDTSLTKYYIKLAEHYLLNNNIRGYDFRGLNPYGSTFDFVQLDYTNENDITLLRLSGEIPVADIRNKPQATAISYYNKTGAEVQYYASVHDYFDESNSSVADYPMPGRRDSNTEIDIVSLFADDWPLVTDPTEFFSDFQKKSGKIYYDGVMNYTDEISRKCEHYSSGAGNKEGLMGNVFAAIGNFAGNLGVKSKVSSYGEIDGYLSDVRTAAVIGFDIDKWLGFGKESVNSPIANNARGEFYGTKLPVCNIFTSSFSYNLSDAKDFSVSANAEILSDDILNNPGQYSMEIALVSKTGNCVLLTSNSSSVGSAFMSPRSAFRLNATVSLYDINIKESGTYTLQYVLTQKINGADKVIFDTKAHVNVFSKEMYLALEKPVGYRFTLEARTLRVIVP